MEPIPIPGEVEDPRRGRGGVDLVDARQGGTSSRRRLPPPSPFFGRPRFFIGTVQKDVALTREFMGKVSLSHLHHGRTTGPALVVHGWSRCRVMSNANAKLGRKDWGNLK